MRSHDGPRSNRRRTLTRRRLLAIAGAVGLAGCGTANDNTATTTSTTTSLTTETTDRTTRQTTKQTTTPRESFPGTWPGYGFDQANTGHNTESAALSSDARRWATYVPGYYTLPAPAVSATGVYLGSEHQLFGMVRSTGDTAWSVDLGAFTHLFTPSVRDGVVYGVARGLAGADSGSDVSGTIAAIDEVSGDERWRKSAYVSGSPKLTQDLVMYPGSTASTGFIEARALGDGSQHWRYSFGDGSGVFGTPAVGTEFVYAVGTIGTTNDQIGRLVALSPATGEQAWQFDIDAGANAAPVVSEGAVIFADDSGRVHSLDINDRQARWTVDVGDSIYARPAVTPRRVFAISRGELTAISRSEGTIDWTAPIGSSHFSTVSVADGTVYVGGPTLYAYNTMDGSSDWTREIPGYAGAYGGPVVVNGEMFIGACVKTDPGDLYDNFVYNLS